MVQIVPEAIVLAGGFGTRLRGVIDDLPKPLAPICGRPFIAYVLDALSAHGLTHVVLACGYEAEKVQQTLGAGWRGMRLSYSIEDRPLGTGGAIRRAAGLTAGGPVLVLNGDTYLEFDPIDFAQAMTSSRSDLGVALAQVADVSRYGAVLMHGERIASFSEKTTQGSGLINAGVYYFSANALSHLPDLETFSMEADVLKPAAAAGTLYGYTRTAQFIDIGIPEDYALAQTLAPNWQAPT